MFGLDFFIAELALVTLALVIMIMCSFAFILGLAVFGLGYLIFFVEKIISAIRSRF
jgi:hypothetical protein